MQVDGESECARDRDKEAEMPMLKMELFCWRLVTWAAGHKTTHKLLTLKLEVPHLGQLHSESWKNEIHKPHGHTHTLIHTNMLWGDKSLSMGQTDSDLAAPNSQKLSLLCLFFWKKKVSANQRGTQGERGEKMMKKHISDIRWEYHLEMYTGTLIPDSSHARNNCFQWTVFLFLTVQYTWLGVLKNSQQK